MADLQQQRQTWLKAAEVYYLSAGEDSGMHDLAWDALGRLLFETRDQFPLCPILNDPRYDGGSLFWVTKPMYEKAMALYRPGEPDAVLVKYLPVVEIKSTEGNGDFTIEFWSPPLTPRPEPIDFFKDEYRWLSNFSYSPVFQDRQWFPRVENAYQAAKFHIDDPVRQVLPTVPAFVAKKLGQTAKLDPDWDQRKVAIMRTLIQQKFAPETPMADKLLATGERPIIEGNYHKDSFWGIYHPKQGEPYGENHLGRLIMAQRQHLIELNRK